MKGHAGELSLSFLNYNSDLSITSQNPIKIAIAPLNKTNDNGDFSTTFTVKFTGQGKVLSSVDVGLSSTLTFKLTSTSGVMKLTLVKQESANTRFEKK